jgi:ribonuclease G
MVNELIINSRPYETRVALVENGTVAELHIERESGNELMGNIYKGKVVRVLPGMQTAFVDIGMERTGFLYVSDISMDCFMMEQFLDQNMLNMDLHEIELGSVGRSINYNDVSIEDFIKEGQEITVQVSKEPTGTKGARLTCHLSIPGRNLVLMPTVNHIGISRRIEDSQERQRLKSIIEEIRPLPFGFIARTVSEGASKEKLASEMDFLLKLWDDIKVKMEKSSAPALLYRDLSVSLRAVRDLFTREVDRLIIDSKEEYCRIMEFMDTFAPGIKDSVELYEGIEPIFDHYGIEMEISRAMDRKIWLKSGGYIVIELTEALTAIDVNTGSYVGKRNVEETILKTNLEAVKEIAYQLRLRNIGGLIVIDFIDMPKKSDRERVFNALKEELSKDKAKTHVLKMSELGLIEMTRKRTRENLNRFISEPCFYCEGKGILKSKRTICYELFRDIERECSGINSGSHIILHVHPEIAQMLKEEEQQSVIDLERRINQRITIKGKDELHLEQYNIIVY